MAVFKNHNSNARSPKVKKITTCLNFLDVGSNFISSEIFLNVCIGQGIKKISKRESWHRDRCCTVMNKGPSTLRVSKPT